jgi:hypothetical protein
MSRKPKFFKTEKPNRNFKKTECSALATTPEGFGPETSRWETWYFGCGRTPEGATSLLLPGKGRSSSPRF